MHYLNCKKIDTAIRRAKNMLIERAEKKDVYECFGQREVRKIREKFIDICDYSPEMDANRAILGSFEDWCVNYCGQNARFNNAKKGVMYNDR